VKGTLFNEMLLFSEQMPASEAVESRVMSLGIFYNIEMCQTLPTVGYQLEV